MDSSEDDFSAVMLTSLSRIASRWTLLIPIQVELLTLFLNEGKSLDMQITSLRCHHFILARGACNFPSTSDTVQNLFGILQRSELQTTLQLEALKVLHKILLYHLSIIPCEEIPEIFLKMLEVIKNMHQSSIVSTRLLLGRVLSGLSAKVFGRLDTVSGGNGLTLAREVIRFVLDKVLLLATPKMDFEQSEPDSELEVKNMIGILNKLAEQHPYLHCLLLNNICSFIDKLMMMHDRTMETEECGTTNYEMAELSNYLETPLDSKLVRYVSKVVFTCLQNLEVTNADTNRALDLLKVKAENVCRCSNFDIDTRMCYFLLLHLHSTYTSMHHMAGELISPCTELGISFLQLDLYSLDCAKRILAKKGYWDSYKVGRNAACQGAWSVAALMFEQLIPMVKSSSCSGWLKSLTQFSTSEKEITTEINSGTHMKNLLKAGNLIVNAEEILAACDTGQLFRFQRLYLTFRAKFFKAAGDMMKLLDTIPFVSDGIQQQTGTLLGCSTSQTLGPLMHSAMKISFRMRKLVRELELLLVSFMGMDRHSVTSISVLALSCLLVAFTAGFAFLPPWENYEISKSKPSEAPFHALLIQDLVGRLRQKDVETRKKLMTLLKSFHDNKDYFWPIFQTRISYTSYEGIILQKLCEHSVGEIFRFRNEALSEQQADTAAHQIIRNGSRLLPDIISKLTSIPLRIPRYFFRLRPPIVSQLLATSENGETISPSTVLSGPHLSLSLCLQLKNMVPCLLKKAYCIISCKPKSRATTANTDEDANDVAMELNENLIRYMSGERNHHDAASTSVNEFVQFELNERGQGFSSCLVDVSRLPKGSYGMMWQCGGIDGQGCLWTFPRLLDAPLFALYI